MKPPGSTSVVVLTIILLGCRFASAEPYEVAYVAPECEACAPDEGLPGPFPEDQGWTRVNSGATRNVQNAQLALLERSQSICSVYPQCL